MTSSQSILDQIALCRVQETRKLEELESEPLTTTSYDSCGPTDDVHADRLGQALQLAGNSLHRLELNFSGWTKWGAHEVIRYLQDAINLEEVVLRYQANETTTLTSQRTLTSLLEAIQSNPHSSIQEFGLHLVTLEAKSVSPFCQFLEGTTSLRKLCMEGGFEEISSSVQESDIEKIALAFQSNQSIQEIVFAGVTNAFITPILTQMSHSCPSTFKQIKFLPLENDNSLERIHLETKGLQMFLASSHCPLTHLEFSRVQFNGANTTHLGLGLQGNASLKKLCLQDCFFQDESLLSQMIIGSTTTTLHHLDLDCWWLHNRPMVIRALGVNTSIIHCRLSRLQSPSGEAIRDVLLQNRSIQSLELSFAEGWIDQELEIPATGLDEEDLQCIAEGVRSNPVLETLTLSNLGILDASVQHLAEACCPPTTGTPTTDVAFAPLSLSILKNSIGNESLHHFAIALGTPCCRLKSLSLRLDEAPTQSTSEGIVKLMQSLENNTQLETLHIQSLETNNRQMDFLIWETLAKSLPKLKHLKTLNLEFGMPRQESLSVRRNNDSKAKESARAALLEALAKNTSLEHVQFGTNMYRSRMPSDNAFFKTISFYGMRNQLNSILETHDEHVTVYTKLELADRLLQTTLRTEYPWTLPLWQGTAKRAHQLNDLSLVYLALRHVPHLLVSGADSSTATTSSTTSSTTNIRTSRLLGSARRR